MYDTGSTAFMLVCAMLVLLMTPGLAFFYGGLSRRKNVVNTMIMVFSAIGIVAITWTICGWSLAYGGDGSSPFFGGFDQLGFLGGVTDMLAEAEAVPEDAAYPTIVNFIFQMAFCMITTAIITGSLAGRMKFGAVCAFVAVWCTRRSPIWFGVATAALSATPSARSTSQAAMSCTSPLA